MQDPNYKRLFSFPRMVEDLLRAFLPAEALAELDFSSLDKLPAEYVSDELLQRHGDCVWRIHRRGRWLYLLVLLEFQSTDEPRMALRILTYTSLLYQELVRNGALDARERLPAVLPVVLYNGAARRRAVRPGAATAGTPAGIPERIDGADCDQNRSPTADGRPCCAAGCGSGARRLPAVNCPVASSAREGGRGIGGMGGFRYSVAA